MRMIAAVFILVILTACAPVVADPVTMQAWASGALSATQQAHVERQDIATLDAARTQSALVAQQTQAAMQATATAQEHNFSATEQAAQHTAVIQALQATQDWRISGLQQDARIQGEYMRHTQQALAATATQGAIIQQLRRDDTVTDVVTFGLWSLACLGSLALFALVSVTWARQLQRTRILETGRGMIVTPFAGEPYLLTPPTPREAQQEAHVIYANTPETPLPDDDLRHDIYKIVYRSATLHGWDSDRIAGHREIEDISGRGWHRAISALREYIETDRTGTTLIDGTLREFHAELEAGRVVITHPAA